jgi:hypothetical protein
LAIPFSLAKLVATGTVSWSNSDYVWAQPWMSEDYLRVNNADFLADGGANWACEIDPLACDQIYKLESVAENPFSGFGKHTFSEFRNLALLSIIENPLTFSQNRLKYTFRAYTSGAGSPVGLSDNYIKGIIFLFLYLYLITKTIINWRKLDELELFGSTMLVGLLVPILVSHFETRYLMPIQALTLVLIVYQLQKSDKIFIVQNVKV